MEDIGTLLEILKNYALPLSFLGAAVAFIFSVYKFWSDRRVALYWKEFEVYHVLVKELVEPLNERGALYLDRQGAILYELRNFERYYDYSLRMLLGLKQKWSETASNFPRLLDELDITIAYLENQKKSTLSWIFSLRSCQR